ncbi:hypothetical protein E4U57_002540 [Claviceps arundinis]|uniref:Aminoglycoside phosphotransferase domain-containing protein n=1 Tax=Claviceps arundinis TaxID=1623583 RepID=A0A9P7MV76_9HYPO|nr:hypothetical protein E4U57_002540 [Claviceps arundinis]KAG5970925.1 hypothetical protein E4U56_007204 [Claviceps arundinis]
MAETTTTSDTNRVMELLRRVDLEYPDGELLECFVQDSKDPLQTARYILERCSAEGDDLNLATLISDWKRLISVFTYDGSRHPSRDPAVISTIRKRDRGRCCLTGLGYSIWDPLIVVPLLPTEGIQIDNELHELLGIFIGPSLLDWLSFGAASLSPEQNHWLVRRSAAAALAQGFFQFCFGPGWKYSVFTSAIGGPTLPFIIKKLPFCRNARFKDCIASHVDNPDTSALEILSRFANPIRWTGVAREVACKRPRTVRNGPTTSLWRVLSERGAIAVAMAWRLAPAPIRIRAYQGLASLGAHMYGPSCSLNVRRLPFGLYLKATSMRWHRSLANEFAALQLVRRHTNIHVPSALDLVSDSKNSYLLTTTVRGVSLGRCIDTLSHDEVTTLVGDLQKCLLELRAIPKEVSPKYAITSALGEACYDGRLITGSDYDEARGDFFGPFVDEDDFNDTLHCFALPNVLHSSGHEIVLSHGDLNLRNIMMHNGRLSGIIDWETCGWFPDYWDYTKAHFITKIHRRWLKIVDAVFEKLGNFEAELAVERQLWWYCY